MDAIQNNETMTYISKLQTILPCKLSDLIAYAHAMVPELRTFVDANERNFKARDKGSAGKIVEFYIFGRLPNSESTPDLAIGDIKATHVKKVKDGFNAKERLTLTNVGSTNDYANLQHILDFDLETNPRWDKVRRGVMVVLAHSTAGETLNEEVVCLFHYDILSVDAWMHVLKTDYEKIRHVVREKAVTQKGQDYLHIHPHGSKDSKTRAFGFTSKFVTRLICHYTGKELKESGRTLYF